MFKIGDIISPQTHMSIPSEGISLTPEMEGEVVEAEGGNLVVEWTLADGKTKRLPTADFVMRLSTKAEQDALETKATATLITDDTLTIENIKDPTVLLGVIQSLLTRVQYLEKLRGVDHSAKG